ncbi:MAG: hypothetical protein ACFCAD_20190 [Pleurocapsa sp.]
MGESKVLLLTIALMFFAINASATPEKSSQNYQKPGLEITQQFEPYTEFHSYRERINEILQKLNLSAQQSRQAAAIKQKFKTEQDNLYRQIQHHRQEMRTLLSTNTSRDLLRQDYQKTRLLLERLGDNRFEMTIQLRKILTTE